MGWGQSKSRPGTPESLDLMTTEFGVPCTTCPPRTPVFSPDTGVLLSLDPLPVLRRDPETGTSGGKDNRVLPGPSYVDGLKVWVWRGPRTRVGVALGWCMCEYTLVCGRTGSMCLYVRTNVYASFGVCGESVSVCV